MFDWFTARGILPNNYSLVDTIALLQTVHKAVQQKLYIYFKAITVSLVQFIDKSENTNVECRVDQKGFEIENWL
jgi:hypothetical protein